MDKKIFERVFGYINPTNPQDIKECEGLEGCPGGDRVTEADPDPECCKDGETIPIGTETDKSAARGAEVEQHMKDLKKEIQGKGQDKADASQPKAGVETCEDETTEEPKEEFVLQEPKGTVSVAAAVCPEHEAKKEEKDNTRPIRDTGAAKYEVERLKKKIAYNKKHPKKCPVCIGTQEVSSEDEMESVIREDQDPWLPHLPGVCMVCGKPATIKGEMGDEYCSVECQKLPAPKSKMQPISYEQSLGGVGAPNAMESAEAKIPEFGVSEMSDFRSIFEGARKNKLEEDLSQPDGRTCACGAPAKHVHDHMACCGNPDTCCPWANGNESKINEEEGITGGASVATDAGALEPMNTGKPTDTKAQNPETFDKQEDQPESDEHGEKEYFGKQGDDNYYYVLAVPDESDGAMGGMASEEKPDVTPETKPADNAPVEGEARPKAPEIFKARESKTEEGIRNVDVADKDYWRVKGKLKGPTGTELDDADKEVIKKVSKHTKETAKLDKMYKMDNSKVPNESKIHEGYSNVQIVDATGKVVADAKEQDMDPNDIKGFLLKNMDDLELTEITPDIVKKYLLADENSSEEEEEMTSIPKEEKTIKNQGEPPNKSEEVTPGMSMASESKITEEKADDKGEEKKMPTEPYFWDNFELGDESVKILLTKYNLLEKNLDNYKCCSCGWEGDANTDTCPSCKKKLDPSYKGAAQESIEKELMEKYGLQPSDIDVLLEKFQLNEADPALKQRPKVEDPRDKDLTGQPMTPQDMDTEPAPIEQGADTATAVAEPTTAGSEAPLAVGSPGDTGSSTGIPGGPAQPIEPAQAQDMSSPESAEVYLRSEFPEEPFTSTILAFADSAIADPKVYGAIRNMSWEGVWSDGETLEKQAKIVGTYGNFSVDAVKSITDKFSNSAKYKLARDVRPVLYVVLRDVGPGVDPISLSELKGIANAREVLATENPGECVIKW